MQDKHFRYIVAVFIAFNFVLSVALIVVLSNSSDNSSDKIIDNFKNLETKVSAIIHENIRLSGCLYRRLNCDGNIHSADFNFSEFSNLTNLTI